MNRQTSNRRYPWPATLCLSLTLCQCQCSLSCFTAMSCNGICKMFQRCIRWLNSISIGTHHSTHIWLNLDACGLICGVLTFCLIGYGDYVFTWKLVYPWLQSSHLGLFHISAFNLFALLAMISHVRAMLTDPGAVPKAQKNLILRS